MHPKHGTVLSGSKDALMERAEKQVKSMVKDIAQNQPLVQTRPCGHTGTQGQELTPYAKYPRVGLKIRGSITHCLKGKTNCLRKV